VFDDSQNRETQAIKQALDPKSTGVFKSIGIKLTNLHKARGITASSKNTSYLNIGVWNVRWKMEGCKCIGYYIC
ncbi:MAG: hypothetical protein K8S13_23270, partial [Desulfobacula sp.]|uniref:hypothetical protein n=1 Tax=Desulfobacula sp. TaxID=2593537 RepID=UPI0025C44890